MTFRDLAIGMPDPNNTHGLIAFIAILVFVAFVAFVLWLLFHD